MNKNESIKNTWFYVKGPKNTLGNNPFMKSMCVYLKFAG